MDVEIRTIEDDERADWVRAAETSFSAVSKDDEIDVMLPTIENDRSFAAVDGDRIVGTSAAITTGWSSPAGNGSRPRPSRWSASNRRTAAEASTRR